MAEGESLTRGPSIPRYADEVCRHLRRMIIEGAFQPGGPLLYREIERRLGVSRTPVREALLVLEREGWVHIDPHRGAFLQSFDTTAAEDNHQVLSRIYGLAIRRAIERGTTQELEQLDMAGTRALNSVTTDELIRVLRSFWQIVFTTARSTILVAIEHRLTALFPEDWMTATPDSADHLRQALGSLMGHVQARRPEHAQRAGTAMLSCYEPALYGRL